MAYRYKNTSAHNNDAGNRLHYRHKAPKLSKKMTSIKKAGEKAIKTDRNGV
jgi:hypothetical protein